LKIVLSLLCSRPCADQTDPQKYCPLVAVLLVTGEYHFLFIFVALGMEPGPHAVWASALSLSYSVRRIKQGVGCLWLMLVILATQEAEIRRIVV
jgi:hypothetical protein